MEYNVFIFDGSFTNYDSYDCNVVTYQNLSAEDTKQLVDLSLRNGKDVVLRCAEECDIQEHE